MQLLQSLPLPLTVALACRFTNRGGSLMVLCRVYLVIAPITDPVAQIPIIPSPNSTAAIASSLLFGGLLAFWGGSRAGLGVGKSYNCGPCRVRAWRGDGFLVAPPESIG